MSSPIDDILRAAEPLNSDDRMRLMVRVWLSLPPDHWAAPTDKERAALEHRLNVDDWEALGRVPWQILDRLQTGRQPKPRPKVYSAPRRFDLATIFVVTTAYSLLFAAMSGLQFPPIASLLIAGFITFVGIGQALLFHGSKPRQASIVVGSAVYTLATLAFWLFFKPPFPDGLIFVMVGYSVVGGAILGYFAGVLVGGVFLVAEALRTRMRHTPIDSGSAEPANPPDPQSASQGS